MSGSTAPDRPIHELMCGNAAFAYLGLAKARNFYRVSAFSPSRFGIWGIFRLKTAEEYRRYAAECLELANVLRVPRARAALKHMAQVWLRLAQDAEVRSRSSQQGEVSEPY